VAFRLERNGGAPGTPWTPGTGARVKFCEGRGLRCRLIGKEEPCA